MNFLLNFSKQSTGHEISTLKEKLMIVITKQSLFDQNVLISTFPHLVIYLCICCGFWLYMWSGFDGRRGVPHESGKDDMSKPEKLIFHIENHHENDEGHD